MLHRTWGFAAAQACTTLCQGPVGNDQETQLSPICFTNKLPRMSLLSSSPISVSQLALSNSLICLDRQNIWKALCIPFIIVAAVTLLKPTVFRRVHLHEPPLHSVSRSRAKEMVGHGGLRLVPYTRYSWRCHSINNSKHRLQTLQEYAVFHLYDRHRLSGSKPWASMVERR